MVRIKASVARRERKKRLLKEAKGQFGHKKSRFRQAVRSVIKGMAYSYRDRKVKKREFKSLWIIRINAACRAAGLTYSRFINGLSRAGVTINRKMLAEVAATDEQAFNALVEVAKASQSVSAS
ncbi:MAG TPA: 50S ribosomal protein L20 [Candidatus Omnitrophota bacterium]|jgi:large subunit ribosomal protein L20|nr:50S ribosomal protein L20 [Candidatus Omnitrophota bacterium]